MRREFFCDANGVVGPIEDASGIYGFFGKYRCFSNFYECQVVLDGVTYRCSEGAYMAQKTLDRGLREEFASLGGKDAKRKGQSIALRPDWDDIHRIHAMYRAVFAKFSQNQDILGVLLGTGSKYLEETNWWGDHYWGSCDGTGKNHLGQSLMTVRDFFASIGEQNG